MTTNIQYEVTVVMANTNTTHKLDTRLFDTLLTPSWLSGLIVVVAGLVIVIGVIISFSSTGGALQQQLINWQNTRQQTTLTLPGQIVDAPENSLQTSWPLLALIVYFIVEELIEIARSTHELKEELNYVHARRQDLIRDALGRLFIRIAALIVWLIFIDIFLKRIIPYSITAAQAGTADLVSLQGLYYELLAFVMIAFSLHVHTIFLRIVVRKPRVFADVTYT
jgi:hypothetical protein